MSQFKSYDEMTDGERRAIVDATSDAWENYDLSNPTNVGNMSNGTRFLREALRAVRRTKVKHYETEWCDPRPGERYFAQAGDKMACPTLDGRPNILTCSASYIGPRVVIVREWEV